MLLDSSLFKHGRREFIILGIAIVASLVIGVSGWYALCVVYNRLSNEARIKGRFEFKINDTQAMLTEDEAVNIAQISLMRVGLDAKSMRISEDPITGKRMGHPTQGDLSIGMIDFRGPPPHYTEYIVEVTKKNGFIKTTVVLGE